MDFESYRGVASFNASACRIDAADRDLAGPGVRFTLELLHSFFLNNFFFGNIGLSV